MSHGDIHKTNATRLGTPCIPIHELFNNVSRHRLAYVHVVERINREHKMFNDLEKSMQYITESKTVMSYSYCFYNKLHVGVVGEKQQSSIITCDSFSFFTRQFVSMIESDHIITSSLT